MASTKNELVAVLIAKQKSLPKRSHNLAWVIERARNGKYHDWESDLATPKLQLVMDLKRCPGCEEIIKQVMDDVFDESPTPAQLEELRAQLGPETYDKLFPQDAKHRGSA